MPENTFNPSLIANFIYDLVKEYNQFYHDILDTEGRGKCRDT